MQSAPPAPVPAPPVNLTPPGASSPGTFTPIASPLDASPGRTVAERRHRQQKVRLTKRARSVPFKRPYIIAIAISAVFYLALIGTAAAIFAFIVQHSKISGLVLITFGGISAILWVFSFFKRRSCRCPLCKGTPLLDNGAHRHEKAVRFFPLNYGNSNVVCSLFCQHFRCQFCGTPFDLLKPRDH